MEMSDADIAREMNLVRSTIHEHRTRSLEVLKKIMEGIADEKRGIKAEMRKICCLSIL